MTTARIDPRKAARKRKLVKAVAVAAVGAILALACRALPPEYRSPCETVIKICTTGGL